MDICYAFEPHLDSKDLLVMQWEKDFSFLVMTTANSIISMKSVT